MWFSSRPRRQSVARFARALWCVAALLGILQVHAYDRCLPPVKWDDASTHIYGASYSGDHCPATADFTLNDFCGGYDIRVSGSGFGTPEQTLARVMAFRASYWGAYDPASCVAPMTWTAGACDIQPNVNRGTGSCRYTGSTVTIAGPNCYGTPGQTLTFNNSVFIGKTCRTPGGKTDGIDFDGASRECVCRSGVFVPESDSCVPVMDRTIFKPCETCYGNPIFPEQGIKTQSFSAGWEPWTGMKLVYNTLSKLPYAAGQTPFLRSDPDSFGPMWTATFDKVIYVGGTGAASLVNVARGAGNWTSFSSTAGALMPVAGQMRDRLSQSDAGYLYRDADRGTLEEYNARGQLMRITARDGRTLAITRSGLGTVTEQMADEGLPMFLTDHFGRRWSFDYTNVGPEGRSRVSAIVDPALQRVQIAYGANQEIANLSWPDGAGRQMLYERSDLPWALTGYLDEKGIRAGTYGYDEAGRAISTQRALGLDAYSVTWSKPPEMKVSEWYDPSAGVVWRDHILQPPQDTAVTLPNGALQRLTTATSFGAAMWTSRSQPAGASGGGGSGGSGGAASNGPVLETRAVDLNLNVTQSDDLNGNRSCMTFDMSRNLETVRVEGLSAAVDCATVASAMPGGARKTSTQWHPDWSLTTRVAEPRRITTLIYSGQPDPFNGGAIASCAPASALLPDGKPIVVLCKRVEQATTDETGALGFGATTQSGVPARATSWTYNAVGQVLTEKNPLGKVVVTNVYYADTTADHTMGDLQSTSNVLGHLTQFPRYNAYGQPLEMVDSNGISTAYAYDARQRLLSTTTQGAVTGYEYFPTGLLKKTTQPDNSFVTYEYDDARRLVAVADSLGNRIEYTLDASGNRTQELAKDPQGALQRAMSRVYDALSRAQQTTGRE